MNVRNTHALTDVSTTAIKETTGIMRFASHRVTLLPAIVLGAAVVLFISAAFATAADAQVIWRINSLASTTAAPGGTIDYRVQITNAGGSTATASEEAPVSFSGSLPSDLTISSVSENEGSYSLPFDCSSVVSGSHAFTCTVTSGELSSFESMTFTVEIAVDPGAEEGDVLTSHFGITGSAPVAATVGDPTTISSAPLPFGIDSFDNEAIADAVGGAFVKAAAHPYGLTTSIDFNTYTDPNPFKGNAWPVAPTKDVSVDLPPGLLGDVSQMPRCTVSQLAHASSVEVRSICPPAAQLGTALVHSFFSAPAGFGVKFGYVNTWGPLSVYNMVPPPGKAARFAFNVAGTIVTLDVRVRSSSDYGVSVDVSNISEGLAVSGNEVTLWGDPEAESHLIERSCSEAGGGGVGFSPGSICPGEGTYGVLRMPTSCTAPGEGLATTARIDSWFEPGVFDESTAFTHVSPGFPSPRSEWGAPSGTQECAKVPFNPGLAAQPTTNVADSPSGLDLHIKVPQECWSHPESICQSDLENAEVKLPQGMTLNPSAASGLGACTPGQIGLTTPVGQAAPIHFNEAPAACPENSKIGTVNITTPLLEEELTGAVYLAKQSENPFKSLLAMYLVAEAPERGVIVKQAGEITTDPKTGRLTTTFKEAPQTPFSDLHVSLFGGPRAPLRTPPTCGTYGINAKLTPWSGNAPANLGSAFEIESCPNSGFDPHLSAGTQNPLAGSYSPFSLRLTREDGTQEIAGLSAHLPKGLIGKPAGIPYCPDSVLKSISEELGTGTAQIAKPSCPAASQVGTVTVGAGAGPTPFFTTSGRAYWAGPYKGAPLSLAVVAPAVAGPFDLGNVVVRNALNIDPETAEVTAVSDPIPAIVHGIPLDLRDIRINLDRPDYILNPTSCEPMAIGATLTSTQGAIASPSNHFQVAGCDRLGFKPKLSLRLSGKTNRGAHPAIRAVLTMPPANQANIARAQVTLPRGEFLDQSHIVNVCTHVQFQGAGCPASSVLGYARAISPLLDNPLEGPVYLMSGFGHKLPDVAADLNGQIRVLLHGKVDTGPSGGIRTTFEVVPDAPVTKFVLSLKGGKRGLIQYSEDACARPQQATALFDAQNGISREFSPVLKVKCGGTARKKRHR